MSVRALPSLVFLDVNRLDVDLALLRCASYQDKDRKEVLVHAYPRWE